MKVALKSPPCRRGGFSLIELVVATGITLGLAVLLLSATNSMLSAWNRTRGGLMSSNYARLALDQLTSDLEGALFRNDGNVWMAATMLETNNPAATTSNNTLSSQRQWVVSGLGSTIIKPRCIDAGSDPRGFDLDEPEIAECRFGLAGVWLRFFTTKLDNSTTATTDSSAPAAVSYQLRRRRVGGATSECAYMLYRSVVRVSGGSSTFAVGYDLDPAASGSPYTSPSGGDGNAGNVILPNTNHVIANNVIDFGVRFFAREGTTLRLIFPAQPAASGAVPLVGVPSDSDMTVPVAELSHLVRAVAAVDPGDVYRNRRPDVVEVTLRVLTDEGAAMIRALEAGRLQGDWWDIANAHSQAYTRRIELRGGGL